MTATVKNCWDVLVLYVIPIGGGIPAGVLLAQHRGLTWPVMMGLYFLSDVLLAFVFEPLMWIVIHWGKRSASLKRFLELLKEAVKRTTPRFGHALGPLALVAIAFGVDPMTGRVAAKASGHGFLSGWALAITGDMFYFSMLMVSTLWLNNILGNGTWTMVIMLVVMMAGPEVLRRFRGESAASENREKTP